jgi:ATP-binding cassette, subfamily B, multidrug efflux pump
LKSNKVIDNEKRPLDFKLLKRLYKFIKPYRSLVILPIVLTLVTSALAPVRPYLMKIAIDDYITPGDDSGLLLMIIIIFGMLVLHALLQYVLGYIMQKIGQKMLRDIRVRVFEHIQKLSLSFHDKNPVGKLVTRVTNDIEALNDLFSTGIVVIIADLMMIVWIVIFMFITNIELTFISMALLPILFLITSVFRKKVRVIFSNIRTKVAEMNTFLNEFITGIITVKLFAQEKNQTSKFDEVNSSHQDLWIKTIFYYALFFPTVEMLSTLGLALVIWYTAGNILSGLMTIGILIAFLQYAEMFYRPIRDLTEKYTTLQSAMAAAERVYEILDTEDLESTLETKLEKFEDKIEFRDMSFSYDDEKWVLKNLSLEIMKGETLAIVGATGAGKTSIVNLLLKFYDYQKGQILIDGKDLRDIDARSLREKIALVMQDVFLFSRSVSDNISLGDKSIDSAKIIDSAKALGAYEFVENLPEKYDSLVHERGVKLSAGQRQLISFCRAYAADPEILILDEATSNIDSYTESIIEKSLQKLLKNRTSVVIAHRLSTIKNADKIAVLHHGELRELGTHKELLTLGGIYSRLYKLQFEEHAVA